MKERELKINRRTFLEALGIASIGVLERCSSGKWNVSRRLDIYMKKALTPDERLETSITTFIEKHSSGRWHVGRRPDLYKEFPPKTEEEKNE